MTPENTIERFLCSVYMMASGFMWAYVIGTVAGIATTLNPNNIMFENTMDSLNYFMRERELPRPMRITLREFFTNARRVHQVNDDSELLDKMSPLLQGTVALAANRQWCISPHLPTSPHISPHLPTSVGNGAHARARPICASQPPPPKAVCSHHSHPHDSPAALSLGVWTVVWDRPRSQARPHLVLPRD